MIPFHGLLFADIRNKINIQREKVAYLEYGFGDSIAHPRLTLARGTLLAELGA